MQSVCNNEIFTASADFDEKMILKFILEKKEWECVGWTDMAQDRVKWWALVKKVTNIGFRRSWRHI
jgi:hypothetical protein